jgi:hypothetical protein
MKFDEKTGKEIPESRSDEIKISHKKLEKISNDTGGLLGKEFEMAWNLCDINVSLGILVDMVGVILNRMIKEDNCLMKEVNEAYDERTDKPS